MPPPSTRLRAATSVLLAGLLLTACSEPPGETLRERQISVQGSTTIQLQPDYVQFSFHARRDGKAVQPLKAEVDAVTNRVVAALAPFAIAEQDFTSSGVRVERRFEHQRDRGQVFVGFTVSRDYDLKVRSINDYERIVDALTQAGVEDLSGARVQLDDEQAHQRDALAAAVAVAEAKARAMAEQLGAELGVPLDIAEDGVQPRFALRGQPETMSMDANGQSGPPPLVPQAFEVTARVRVTFALGD